MKKTCLIYLLLAPMLMHSTVALPKLQGQYGNTLFQIAAAIALAHENRCLISLPESLPGYASLQTLAILNHYRCMYDRIAREVGLCPYQSVKTYIDGPTYAPIPYEPGIEIFGFFQSEKYFENCKDLIKRIFSISEPIEDYLHSNFGSILSHPKTVGIHIRTAFPEWKEHRYSRQFFNGWLAPDLAFYKKAISRFDEDSLFIVCCDHPSWAKKHFKEIPRQFVFIENQEGIHDFYLLTKCKNMIISASTMGWWAAYLIENPNACIIYRHPFYDWRYSNTVSNNLVKKEWIAINMPEAPPPIPHIND